MLNATYQDPSQNDDASFMSSQMPENSTPELDQLRSASVQYCSAFGANQSGKTVYPGQTWPTYSLPSGFLMNVSLEFCSVQHNQNDGQLTYSSTPRV